MLVLTIALERHVPMFLGWIGVAFVLKHLQRIDQYRPRLAWLDHGIYVSVGCVTAPSGPITANSAVGQATLKSPRICLELMTI